MAPKLKETKGEVSWNITILQKKEKRKNLMMMMNTVMITNSIPTSAKRYLP